MGYRVSFARPLFWGGLALLVMVGQQTGLLSSKSSASVGVDVENNVVRVRSGDQTIEEAVRQARQSLPAFLERAESAPSGWEMVSLKVALEGDTMVENIWVSDFQRPGFEIFTGRLANDPVDLPGLKAGDLVKFSYDQISDWAFVENGRGYGFYTTRVLTEGISEEELAMMNAFLSPDPVPTGW
ncbi:MAG: DUF2314 domain-containing protein [Rhodobacter sp.]|nr:DUF2314 domain-containing protein [Rhodobacter sp.]